jgi:hypothetical protein
MPTKHPSNEKLAICVSWSDFTATSLVSCVGRCLRLRHSSGRTRSIVRRRARSLILGTGGPSTRIEDHLTHQLRVRHEIYLK